MALVPSLDKAISSRTPYQLDPDQTLRASRALLEHIRAETQRIQKAATKRELLKTDDSDDQEGASDGDDIPVWLNLTTKQHVVDRNRLKPSRISVPHSLNSSPNLSICLITADPQRAVKNAIADPSFPKPLSSRISRIIGYSKLKARYKTFEQRRELLSEHDIFLADDRVINRLPATLGKVFYKGTVKRPIPVNIAPQPKVDGEKVKAERPSLKSKDDKSAAFTSPATVAREIERAVDSVPVSLRPGTLVAARVGLASFTPQELSDNINTVASRVIEKHVVKGWRNVKAIHIKSPTSMAIPIWLADELWAENQNVDADGGAEALEAPADSLKRKRNPATRKGPQVGQRKRVRLSEVEAENGQMDALRKSKLAAQKAEAFKAEVMAA